VNVVSKSISPQQALTEAERLFSTHAFPQAEKICWRIIRAQPTYHPAYFQLALIAVQVGKPGVAIELITRALEFSPAEPVYHRTLCELYRRAGRLDMAISHGAQAVQLAPKDSESYYNYGLALADGLQYELAIKHYIEALRLNPKHGFAYNNLGSAYEKSGNLSAAQEAYKNAVRVNAKNAEAHNNLGALFSANGDLENARTCFEKAIEIAPAFVSAHCNVSTIKKYKTDDSHIPMLEQLRPHINNMSVEEQIKYWFAYGKACNDTKRYVEAFDSYQQGNLLKRSTYKYDESIIQKNIDDIIRRFDSKLFTKSSHFEDPTPVFIVGMPRSGTTLIEQIISSHSAVCGAGELKDLSDIISAEANLDAESSYIDWLRATVMR
jgi:Flp pilus assembly protein TadD